MTLMRNNTEKHTRSLSVSPIIGSDQNHLALLGNKPLTVVSSFKRLVSKSLMTEKSNKPHYKSSCVPPKDQAPPYQKSITGRRDDCEVPAGRHKLRYLQKTTSAFPSKPLYRHNVTHKQSLANQVRRGKGAKKEIADNKKPRTCLMLAPNDHSIARSHAQTLLHRVSHSIAEEESDPQTAKDQLERRRTECPSSTPRGSRMFALLSANRISC